MRVIALILSLVAVVGCTTRAVPSERTYVDPDSRVIDLAALAVSNLGGRVLAADRLSGTITASFPSAAEGPELILEARLDRHVDETVVSVVVHAGSRTAEPEALEELRARFFAELDALAERALPGTHLTPGRAPTPWPAPGPWPPVGRG